MRVCIVRHYCSKKHGIWSGSHSVSLHEHNWSNNDKQTKPKMTLESLPG